MEEATLVTVMAAIGQVGKDVSAVGELAAAEIRAVRVETAGIRLEFHRLNGSVGNIKDWIARHEGSHGADAGAALEATSYDAGREFERTRVVGFVRRAYEVGTHPLVLAVLVSGAAVGGWLLGALK